jgi:hypothetical protein
MFKAFKRRQSDEEQVDELLSAFLDGQLTPAERARLEARLAVEPALRKRLEGLRWTVAALAGLPEVELPRNFILSPAMASTPRPAARSRRRPTAPVFGWATAVATLLFLLLLAGDLFVVAPSLRRERVETMAREPVTLTRVVSASEAEGLMVTLEVAPAPEMAATEAERPERPEVEKEVALAVEAPTALAEATAVPTQEPQVSMAEAPPPAPAAPEEEAVPAEEATQERLQAETPSPEATPLAAAPAPSAIQGTPSPTGVVTVTVTVEAAVVVTPELPAAEPGKEVPLAVSPPAEEEKTDTDRDAGPRALQEQEATALPEPVAVVPLEEMPAEAVRGQTAEGVPFWLRLVEIGLGLLVVGLVAATLIARRRAARPG